MPISQPIIRTRAISASDPWWHRDLLTLLPGRASSSWVRGGEGVVGWGVAARFDASGPNRFAEIDAWWRDFVEAAAVEDELEVPGTGPVGFVSLAFADQPGASTVIVPEVVVGRRGEHRWITTVGEPDLDASIAPITEPGTVRYSDGQLSTTTYRAAVADAIRRMQSPGDHREAAGQDGIADKVLKVVLAHDLIASTEHPLDVRFLLHNLAERYPTCWTFAVDGLFGATPELLLERTGDTVRSRVLAGTAWPHDGSNADQLATELRSSPKNQHEHAYAIESLACCLDAFCTELSVPSEPDILRLRNVVHLASDVHGRLDSRADNSTLRILEALHPTAAVGGTPTPEAVRLIRDLEGMDRGGYSGPVGWVDGAGNGEFGIALRCAQIQQPDTGGGQIRLFAGCGIVAESDPDQEVAEAEAKLLPIREALEGIQ